VASSLCRGRGATSITLSRRCTLIALKYHLETKTKTGLFTKCAKLCWNFVIMVSGMNAKLKFGVPMVWREPTNHLDNFFFKFVDLPVSIRKPNNTYNTISHLPDNQLHTVRKYLCHCLLNCQRLKSKPSVHLLLQVKMKNISFWAIWCRLWQTL